MQAFALTVLSFDGAQAQRLYEQLEAQGYAVTVGSVFESDPVTPAAPTVAAAAPVTAADPVAPEAEAATPDNGLPFKCPACGRTYPTAAVCAVEHPPEATLPTQDVLAGAPTTSLEDAPKDAPAAAGASPDAAAAAVVADPSAGATTPPAGPSWPAEA